MDDMPVEAQLEPHQMDGVMGMRAPRIIMKM